MGCRWIFPEPPGGAAVDLLRRELGIPGFLAGMLVSRGFHDPAAAESHLRPMLKSLPAPEALAGTGEAAARLWQAVDRGERVVLYGDYDVDGVASLAILSRFLRAHGLEVRTFLPSRADDGYGLGIAALERCCADHQPSLLVAVDCGTTSVDEIEWLARRGIDTIILDHHEPGPRLPAADVLVNPKTGSAMHHLCSAGVVFKVCHAMLRQRRDTGVDLRDYLDLAALATVADIVPLVEENRTVVRHGLARMPRSKWPGLRALMAVAGVGGAVRASDLGFRLGPRINAAGRLGPAARALRLLSTDDPVEAARIAAELDARNRERQVVERRVLEEAIEWVEGNFDPACGVTIVAGRRGWHTGVIGVVASRLMRKYHRPAFVIGFDANGEGKGSGRSIEGLPLVELLGKCASHLVKFGGHEMAAGLSIRESELGGFREAFEQAASALVEGDMLVPRVRLDCELDPAAVDDSVMDAQEMLEPFGASNSRPVYHARGIAPAGAPRVMKEKHLRLDLDTGRRRTSAVFFNAPLDDLPRPPWDLAYTLEWNEWQGRVEPQIRIVSMRSSR
jgi:single-stranded-DNA-specific exonuclease